MAQATVAPDRILLIGGSAGSLDPLLRIVAALPPASDYAVAVIVHRKPSPDSILTDLLASKTKMPVKEVEDKEALCSGHVYLAPADYHLLFENRDLLTLDASHKVHYSRPSIDVSFESAAAMFGKNTVGVLLSGANADGAAGLARIKAAGGITLVQDPTTAEVYYMPQQAIAMDAATYVVGLQELPGAIANLLWSPKAL